MVRNESFPTESRAVSGMRVGSVGLIAMIEKTCRTHLHRI